MRCWALKGVLLALVLALIPALKISADAAGPQSPACGNYKVVRNEVIAGVKFAKGTYQINTFGISCGKVMGSKGLFAQFLKLKDKDPLPKPWRYLADAIGAPKFSSGPGVGFRVQLISATPTKSPTPTPTAIGVLKYFELSKSFTTATNPTSPDKLATCRLTDQRPLPLLPEGTRITYPVIPHTGSVVSGVEKIAVVGFDFSDTPGQGNPMDILGDNLEKSSQFFNWYSNGKVKLEFKTYDKWIRLSQTSSTYITGEHFTSTAGALTVTDMAKEFNSAVNKYINLSGYTAVIFVYPKNIETITQNYGLAAGWNGLPAFYGVGPSYYPIEFPYWTFIIHEMLHEQGLQGHSPKDPWVFGILLNGNGTTSGLNSWDELAVDWLTEEEIYCIDKANLKPVQINLAPIERQQAGVHTIMVKLDNHRALVIESHRQGDFAQGMPDYGYGVTLQLVDTTKATTWENDTNATSVYLKIPTYNRYGPEYGTRINNKYADDSGVNLYNGIGVAGARWGLNQNILMLEGEKYTFEGITIEFVKSGNTDLISLTN